MFESNDEQYLLDKIGKNDVLLFLGAGFTHDAININGENLPLGETLSKKIWNFLGLIGSYSGDSLSTMYDALLKSGKKERVLIKEFIEANFTSKEIPEYYEYLFKAFWYKIYTTNIDDVVEKVYKKSKLQRVEILKYPQDEPKERDQFLEFVQLIHMHGKVPCDPDDLIFSTSQYAKGSLGFQAFYQQLIQEFSLHPTIFIGTNLDEPLFWQYIEERKTRVIEGTDLRSKSFVICPNITEARKIQLKQFKVIPVVGYAKDFLEWLNKHTPSLPSKEEIVKQAHPDLADYYRLDGYNSYRREIKEFEKCFEKINKSKIASTGKSDFLLGLSPTWEDIYKNLDAPRNLTRDLVNDVKYIYKNEKGLKIIALIGNAGSGKSTILKRLGVTLAQDGRNVLFTNSEELPNPQIISQLLTIFEERVVLLFDNAEIILKYLPILVKEIENIPYPPILIISSRTNDFDRLSGKYKAFLEMAEHNLLTLERNEIIGIIDTLNKNGLLGKLQGMSVQERIKEFEIRSQKQLLVAMREATSGYGFDKILKDEFDTLIPDESKIICSCVALATFVGYSLTKEELISLSEMNPGDTLTLLARNLNGIVIPISPGSNYFVLRHRTIADYLVKQTIPKEILKISYIKILKSLSLLIRGKKYNSRIFKLYRSLINHSQILEIFDRNARKASVIYDALKVLLADDYHFWLQFGSLELETGNLNYAENYLSQAASLNMEDDYIITAQGHLLFKKAIQANSISEARYFREKGEDILLDRITKDGTRDPYCYFIYCHQSYLWIKKWLQFEEEEKKKELNDLVLICKAGHNAHPKHGRIDAILDVVQVALYNLGIEPSNRPEDPEVILPK